MSTLLMDYSASQSIAFNSASADALNERKARFFHIGPFGQAEQHPALRQFLQMHIPSSRLPDAWMELAESGVPPRNPGFRSHPSGLQGKVFPGNRLKATTQTYLVPQFKHLNQADDKLPVGHPIPHEAELYIGISGLRPPQNLALLLQVADGTADPLAKKPDPHIHWSYLRGNEWITFAENDVDDHTDSLLNSGIITFTMPRDASETNTLLPAKMHWIRAAVGAESDAVCRLVRVATQALETTFINKKNDPAFPATVLAPGTITKLDKPDAAIKKIVQPFPTFGGRGAERPEAFYTRISERLRHKDRAIALWDYERLILEAFPQIYKAKCLNHTRYEPTESGSGIYQELAPGHVTIVTIPNQQFHHLRDPLRPYTSLGLLGEIDTFLHKRLSCFITLHVRNPQFEDVRVVCKVRLHNGFDATFYVSKLQETITYFLSPWAFPSGGGPSFGGKIYKSVLINLVEEQPYVDYVTDFELFHIFLDMDGTERKIEKNAVEGSKAVSILVSVPAKQHDIQVIKPAV